MSLIPAFDAGSDMWIGRLRYSGVEVDQSAITVVGPQDTCRGLQVVRGSCPSNPYEIAVSAAEAAYQHWTVGTTLRPVEDVPGVASPEPFPKPFTITAFFRQLDDPGHWQGVALEGRAGQFGPPLAYTPLMDGWVTPASTFAVGWKASRVDVVWLLDRDRVTLDGLAAIVPGVEEMQRTGPSKVPPIVATTAVSDLVSGVIEGQRQARVIVPLLVGQLAVLAVVVLGLAAAAAVEQRRPELALGRLRGRGPAGAARMVLVELGTIVAAGVPVGYRVAVGMAEVASVRAGRRGPVRAVRRDGGCRARLPGRRGPRVASSPARHCVSRSRPCCAGFRPAGPGGPSASSTRWSSPWRQRVWSRWPAAISPARSRWSPRLLSRSPWG